MLYRVSLMVSVQIVTSSVGGKRQVGVCVH